MILSTNAPHLRLGQLIPPSSPPPIPPPSSLGQLGGPVAGPHAAIQGTGMEGGVFPLVSPLLTRRGWAIGSPMSCINSLFPHSAYLPVQCGDPLSDTLRASPSPPRSTSGAAVTSSRSRAWRASPSRARRAGPRSRTTCRWTVTCSSSSAPTSASTTMASSGRWVEGGGGHSELTNRMGGGEILSSPQ